MSQVASKRAAKVKTFGRPTVGLSIDERPPSGCCSCLRVTCLIPLRDRFHRVEQNLVLMLVFRAAFSTNKNPETSVGVHE